MGTNYYLHEKEPCAACGHGYADRHIGKSSGGWCFSLHVYPEEGINDICDYEPLWSTNSARIVDEYGKTVSIADMRLIIMARNGKSNAPMGAQEMSRNQAIEGPNGLLRHRIEPGRCIAHGPGTWDCIVGEFS